MSCFWDWLPPVGWSGEPGWRVQDAAGEWPAIAVMMIISAGPLTQQIVLERSVFFLSIISLVYFIPPVPLGFLHAGVPQTFKRCHREIPASEGG